MSDEAKSRADVLRQVARLEREEWQRPVAVCPVHRVAGVARDPRRDALCPLCGRACPEPVTQEDIDQFDEEGEA